MNKTIGFGSPPSWSIESSSESRVVLRGSPDPGAGGDMVPTATMAALAEEALTVTLKAHLAPGSSPQLVVMSVHHLCSAAATAMLRAEVTVRGISDQYATVEARLVGPDHALLTYATATFAIAGQGGEPRP